MVRPGKQGSEVMAKVAVKTPRISVISPIGIISYPSLFTPRAPMEGMNDAAPRYQAVLIFGPETLKSPAWAKLKQAVMATAKAAFGENVAMNTLRLPLRSNAERADKPEYPQGGAFISAWSKDRPGVVDVASQPIIDAATVWAGQKARFLLSPFSYSQSGNKGVSFGLQHVQIVDPDMPRIDGRIAVEHAFESEALPAEYASKMGSAGAGNGALDVTDDIPF
jgi:hypothetical protein